MKDLRDYINEQLSITEGEDEKVFAVKDVTGAILNVFPTPEEAEKNAKTWPKEAEAKVVEINKSEIEKD